MGDQNGANLSENPSLPRTRTGVTCYIGTAGWSIPTSLRDLFPSTGHTLERYSHRLLAVEINSSFYRLHTAETYARWSALTPPGFRFAVKLPRQITHFSALSDLETLHRFHESTLGLGEKLGVWLIQLPPRLEWEEKSVARFFEAVRRLYQGKLVCEPRHPSWFISEAESLMHTWQVTRVIAHPPVHPRGEQLLPWSDPVYYRLHGTPQRYISAYSSDFLLQLAAQVRSCCGTKHQVWIIFNNTARGAALSNALEIQQMLERGDEQLV